VRAPLCTPCIPRAPRELFVHGHSPRVDTGVPEEGLYDGGVAPHSRHVKRGAAHLRVGVGVGGTRGRPKVG